MRRNVLSFAAALVWLCVAGAASADISYSYDATTLTPQGRLDGAFSVTEAAIADGSITAGDLSVNFVLSNVSAPFTATTFTTAELSPTIFTINFGEIYVERSSGQVMSGDFSMSATDVETGQMLGMTTHGIGVRSGADGTGVSTPLIISGGGTGAGGGVPGGGPGVNLVYTFTTSVAAPGAGRLSGAFVLPRAAIADGIITFADLISADFALSDAQPPYTPQTLTLANFDSKFFVAGDTQQVRVDPVSGAFLHDFWLRAGIAGGELHLFPHRYVAKRGPSMAAADGRGQGGFTITGSGGGGGGATPVELTALHPVALAALAALLALLATRLRRRRHS